jgi:hypothetical protein
MRFAVWALATAFDCSLQFGRERNEQGSADKARLNAAQLGIVWGCLPTVHLDCLPM